jgi:hypothetical protein
MLHRVIDKADHLQVVDEVPEHEELPLAIERVNPEWVIVSWPCSNHVHNWIDACLADHPEVRFVFLSPHQNRITMRWQSSYEEYTDLSLKEFIYLLENNLQRT